MLAVVGLADNMTNIEATVEDAPTPSIERQLDDVSDWMDSIKELDDIYTNANDGSDDEDGSC